MNRIIIENEKNKRNKGKWNKYIDEWYNLKESNSIKEAFKILKENHPEDDQLRKAKPLSFNRAMNNLL